MNYIFRYGVLAPDICYYDFDRDVFILSGPDGVWVTEKGWHKVKGDYVYVGEDGFLLEGWQVIDGTWYMFGPEMEYGTLELDISGETPRLYAYNAAGQYTEIKTDGLYHPAYVYMTLVRNGKVVTDDWALIDGKWYYFSSYGDACIGKAEIGGKLYYFDNNHQMVSNGWYETDPGAWVYADASGVLYAGGEKVIGGKTYFFNGEGKLATDTLRIRGSELVLSDASGVVTVHTLSEGWNTVNGKRYYFENGSLLRGLRTIDGDTYFFDTDDATMYADRIYDQRYFGPDGRMKTGWIPMADGSWMYAQDGWLYNMGDYYIGEKQYLFDHYKLVVNQTVILWNCRYTVDGSGVIVDKTYIDDDLVDGWNYVTDGCYNTEGSVVYMKDGLPYTGWVGDRYVKNGEMYRNNIEMIDGQAYAFDREGYLLRNEWMEIPSNDYDWEGSCYVYADAGGHPYNEKWLQSGGKWYYFRNYVTACATVIEIDGAEHLFDQNSVWQGAYEDDRTAAGYKDGWNRIGGSWHYVMAGEKVYGEVYDGAWYYCSDDGMMTNAFAESEGGIFYYGASGVRAEYVGWQRIDGRWVYFNVDHSAATGWFAVGGTYYFVSVDYRPMSSEYAVELGMVTGYYAYGDQLLHFDASGAYTGTIVADGWFLGDGDWYYFEDGRLYSGGIYEIDGADYFMGYDGTMQTNCIYYNTCFGADGKAVENGWALVDGEWYYMKHGEICNGVHLIDGVVYYFDGDFYIH